MDVRLAGLEGDPAEGTFRRHIVSRPENELPGDPFDGSHQCQAVFREIRYKEHRILVGAIVRNIADRSALGQGNGLTVEGVRNLLAFPGKREVFTCRAAERGHVLVHIDQTIRSRVERIGAVGFERQLIVVHAEAFLLVGIGGPPAGRILRVRTAAKVSLCVRVQHPDFSGGIRARQQFLRRDSLHIRHEAVEPGDRTAAVGGGGVVHEFEILPDVGCLGAYELVAGVRGVGFLVGNIGEVVSFLQHEEDFFDARLVPVVLDGVGMCVGSDFGLVVGLRRDFIRMAVSQEIGTPVHINRPARSRIVGVLTVGGEGHDVVVESRAFLFIGTAGPPSGGVFRRFPATEMSGGILVPHPCVGDRLHVGSRIERIPVGVLQFVGQDLGALRDAVGIVGLELDGVHAGIADAKGDPVLGVSEFLVHVLVDPLVPEDPEGNDSLVRDGEGYVVRFLVHSDHGCERTRLRKSALIGLDIVDRTAGEQQDEYRRKYVSNAVFHGLARLIVVLYQIRILVHLRLGNGPVFLGFRPVVLAKSVVGSLQYGGRLSGPDQIPVPFSFS